MRTANHESIRAGNPVRSGLPGVLLLSGALFCAASQAAPAVSASMDPGFKGPRTLTVLDPVDLSTNLPDAGAGRMLRQTMAGNPAWRVLPGDSSARQLRDFGIDPDLPCAEFQCAFDAGNALQSEFVLFGTATDLPEVNAYTLGVAHIPTSQMVWSRVGQAPKRSTDGTRRRGNILEGPMRFGISDLEPFSLDLRKRPSRGLLGILDGGQSTPHSRVAVHRALAHAYASRAYDMLGPAELEALLAALDLDPATGRARGVRTAAAGTGPGGEVGVGGSGIARPADASASDDMLALGSAMGVRYLLRSQVRTEGREYGMNLTLYDVAGSKPLREWPSKGTSDYASLLGLEDRFMTALGDEGPAPRATASRHPWRSFAKGASIGLSALGGAALGWMAWQAKTDADAEYGRFKSARTSGEAADARTRVLEKDTEARKYGIMGGVTLALGAAIWTF